MFQLNKRNKKREPWNKGKLMGQKPPLTLQEIWSVRMSLQSEKRPRDMALFNLAIDSKPRAYDLLKIRVSDISSSGQVVGKTSGFDNHARCEIHPHAPGDDDVSIGLADD